MRRLHDAQFFFYQKALISFSNTMRGLSEISVILINDYVLRSSFIVYNHAWWREYLPRILYVIYECPFAPYFSLQTIGIMFLEPRTTQISFTWMGILEFEELPDKELLNLEIIRFYCSLFSFDSFIWFWNFLITSSSVTGFVVGFRRLFVYISFDTWKSWIFWIRFSRIHFF